MNCAPLNLAHFHERRADKLIKRHRYDEAFKAIETSLLYVDDAYKHVKIPKALEVLDTQKWDYRRKLNRIQMQKLQYEKLKSKEIVPSVQVEMASNNIKTDVNAQSIARSIDKTVKEFNDKYGSTLLENIQEIKKQAKESNDFINCNNQKPTRQEDLKGVLNEHLERNIGRLSLIDIHLQSADDDFPTLAPLELPSFDYNVFTVASEEANPKK